MKGSKIIKSAKIKGSYRTISGFTVDQLLSSDMLAYCGYKIEKSNLVPTGNYNPVPYAGIGKVDVQRRK
ncbi:hypothetical protein [Treponema sp.]|uniref:hypothetical protein n=1 Tax=Treponema sp. TaxID=166 RepID=UPI00298E5016|nr:hypothetical protein [Treponema sp.]MCR5612537.1 hypothetical protein [Treponema sp.]